MSQRRLTLFFLFSSALLFLSLSPPLAHGTETANRIIYPLPQTKVTQPEVVVIGTAQGESLLLLQQGPEGRTEYPLRLQGEIFSQPLRLQPGQNDFSLRDHTGKALGEAIAVFFDSSVPDPAVSPNASRPFYLHSKNNLITKCADCHPADAGNRNRYGALYIAQQTSCLTAECHPKPKFGGLSHGPDANVSCIQCHNPHGSFNPGFLKAVRGELCFSCHTEQEAMTAVSKFVHFPVKKGECISCHDVHQPQLNGEALAELCARCHTGRISTNPYKHEPVKEGDCNACHSPHFSEYEGLLVGQATELCILCHGVRKEEFERKYVHEPVKKNCSLCHDPHGSATENHLRTPLDQDGRYIIYQQPLAESCLTAACHTKLDPEVADLIRKAPVKHKPVAEGKCLVCHTPHSTNYPKQLKTSPAKICFASCHKEMEKELSESSYRHGPIRLYDCAQCHLVHGSPNVHLLRANFSQQMYGTFTPEKYELCFLCHNKQVFQEERSPATGFRNGPLNLHALHVNKKGKGRSCASCHAIHASNQEKHIRESILYQEKYYIPLKYTKTETGGGCVVGCHQPRQYDRNNPVSYELVFTR